MKFFITRTSDENYSNAEIKDFSSIESLTNFVNEVGDIVVQSNFWYKNDMSNFKKWYSHLDADEISNIPYEIEIYDTYRE